jgi:hypothetical protein
MKDQDDFFYWAYTALHSLNYASRDIADLFIQKQSSFGKLLWIIQFLDGQKLEILTAKAWAAS